jgi:hypothetical protein
MLVVPNGGVAAMLELVVKSGLTVSLFSNDHTPSASDTLGSYQEPSGGGYSPRKLPGKTWTVQNGVARAPEQVFTFSGPTSPDVIYGYVVKLGNIVMWAERLPEPFPVAIKGDTLIITPMLALKSVTE